MSINAGGHRLTKDETKSHTIVVDDFMKECILIALREKAHTMSGKLRENYMQVYDDIKDQLTGKE